MDRLQESGKISISECGTTLYILYLTHLTLFLLKKGRKEANTQPRSKISIIRILRTFLNKDTNNANVCGGAKGRI